MTAPIEGLSQMQCATCGLVLHVIWPQTAEHVVAAHLSRSPVCAPPNRALIRIETPKRPDPRQSELCQ